MKFDDLRLRFANRPTFQAMDLHAGSRAKGHETVQLSRWTRDGRIVRLKRGLYTLSTGQRASAVSPLTLAEILYRPSYLSLEWALSYYGLIPEAAGTFTGVSTLKTTRFQNAFGSFTYSHLKPEFFFGFKKETIPAPHWLALPEKALLDFFHLRVPRSQPLTKELLLDGYRLQNLDILRRNRLKEMMARFASPRAVEGGRIVLALLKGRHD
jgi:hypothetical protein